MQTFLSQMGKICEAIVNLELFPEVEEHLMHLIQRSFIDNGKKVEHDASHSILKGLSHADSENEFSGASDNLISEWQVNQQSICYNLPGLALFISHGNFFEVLFPHLQSLSGNQFINPRLSLVLPQTCLCIQSDPSRLKIMELICQIGHLALSDHDCNLMRNIMKDMPLLYKAYHPGEENTGLKTSQQHIMVTYNYPMSS